MDGRLARYDKTLYLPRSRVTVRMPPTDRQELSLTWGTIGIIVVLDGNDSICSNTWLSMGFNA